MGSGSFSVKAYSAYNTSMGRAVDASTGRVYNHEYTSDRVDPSMLPYKQEGFTKLPIMRECCNTEEHPNTIPVILALDVTGSMGSACKECAEALGVIVTDLCEKFKDVQIMIMGIGDVECDSAPIQISQFESDVRIAQWLDKLWMEHGGGGNGYESYTAAWYMGLKHTKLDCFDKQGRKGIIITMGDEPLNPRLPRQAIKELTCDTPEASIETPELYSAACDKFDIYHIAVNNRDTAYNYYRSRIEKSFKELLKDNYKVSTIQDLGKTICECIESSASEPTVAPHSEDNENYTY